MILAIFSGITMELPNDMKYTLIGLIFGMICTCCWCCPDDYEITELSELCLRPLGKPTNDTLVGALTAQNWKDSCRIYNASLRCIEQGIESCSKEEGTMGHSILTSIKAGIGQLCENNDTFKRYLKHAHCYARQEGPSVRCLNDFSVEVNYITQNIHVDNLDYSTTRMCRAFDSLVVCVHKLIDTSCGMDAADLFASIIQAQVPRHVTAMCMGEPYPNYHQTSHKQEDYENNGSISIQRIQSCVSSGLLTVLVCIYLRTRIIIG